MESDQARSRYEAVNNTFLWIGLPLTVVASSIAGYLSYRVGAADDLLYFAPGGTQDSYLFSRTVVAALVVAFAVVIPASLQAALLARILDDGYPFTSRFLRWFSLAITAFSLFTIVICIFLIAKL